MFSMSKSFRVVSLALAAGGWLAAQAASANPGVKAPSAMGTGTIEQDLSHKTVTMATGDNSLVMRLNYDNACVLDKIEVNGHDVAAPGGGASTGIEVDGKWSTTLVSPHVSVSRGEVVVTGIAFSAGSISATEAWTFKVGHDSIDW